MLHNADKDLVTPESNWQTLPDGAARRDVHGLAVLRLRGSYRQMGRQHGALLRDGQAAGDVRRDHPVDFLAEMVLGGFHTVMNNWVSMPDYPVKDRIAQTAAFLAEAVSPARRGGWQ